MKYIISDKLISSGAPSIKGSRLTVFNIISKIYYEKSLEIALDDYDISLEEAKEAVEYCSNLSCQNDNNLIKFCSGCLLRTLQDDWMFDKSSYSEIKYSNVGQVISLSKDGFRIFMGSIQELEDNDFGKVGWLLAKDDKDRYPELG